MLRSPTARLVSSFSDALELKDTPTEVCNATARQHHLRTRRLCRNGSPTTRSESMCIDCDRYPGKTVATDFREGAARAERTVADSLGWRAEDAHAPVNPIFQGLGKHSSRGGLPLAGHFAHREASV